jgi:hypothetical protein
LFEVAAFEAIGDEGDNVSRSVVFSGTFGCDEIGGRGGRGLLGKLIESRTFGGVGYYVGECFGTNVVDKLSLPSHKLSITLPEP